MLVVESYLGKYLRYITEYRNDCPILSSLLSDEQNQTAVFMATKQLSRGM